MAADGLRAVQRRHGDDAVATYFGNPSAHTMAVLSGLPLRHVLDTRNHYSATSADQLPQHLTSAEMFGNLALFPIPDIDRTDYMLVLGANPAVSNGSLMTAPGARHRLRAIVARGGSVVVVDPRRTETAAHASEHVAIAPGGDPYLLLGMLHVLFAEGRTRLGHLEGHADGIATIEALAARLAGRARRADRGRRRGDGRNGWRASSPTPSGRSPTGASACATSGPARSRTG